MPNKAVATSFLSPRPIPTPRPRPRPKVSNPLKSCVPMLALSEEGSEVWLCMHTTSATVARAAGMVARERRPIWV